MKKKILFVCTQNVFRSFSAQLLMEKFLEDNNINDFEIDSAGTIAYSFESPYRKTLEVLKELGINKLNRKNKKINKELLEKQDLIICMSKHHKESIKRTFAYDSVLFNEIAYDKSEDLKDDNETDFSNLNNFIEETILYINKSIPLIYQNLDKFF